MISNSRTSIQTLATLKKCCSSTFQLMSHNNRQTKSLIGSLPPLYIFKKNSYNTNQGNNSSPAALAASTNNTAATHTADAFRSGNFHNSFNNGHHERFENILVQRENQMHSDYHQAMNILRELNHIRHQNYLLNKQINHLQEYVHSRENGANLSSWMDTNPFKFGLLCGSVVFVLIALRMDLEKNRSKVKELKEELSKLSIKRRFGNN